MRSNIYELSRIWFCNPSDLLVTYDLYYEGQQRMAG
jgi:hypothetical protein